jgi:hypothetical protein
MWGLRTESHEAHQESQIRKIDGTAHLRSNDFPWHDK